MTTAVNWKAAERTLVAEGEYEATLEGGEIKKNKKQENQVTVTFIINEEGDFQGRKMFQNFGLEDKYLWALRDFFISMGLSEDDFEETDTPEEFLANISDMLSQVAGRDCTITVTHNADKNGKTNKDGTPVVYANISNVSSDY